MSEGLEDDAARVRPDDGLPCASRDGVAGEPDRGVSNDGWTRRTALTCSALLVVVMLCVHAGIASVPFVWDDLPLLDDVRANAGQGVFGVLQHRLLDAGRFVDSPHYYRPIVFLSLHFDHWIWGERAAGYHLLNLLLHTLNAGLLLALCRRAGATPLAATVAALCFGLFPRLTESVSWISGRSDILATTGGLLAIWLHTTPRAGVRQRCGAALALGLGLLAKEIAAASLLALVAVELQRARGSLRELAARLSPAATALVLYLALRFAAGSRGQTSAIALGDRLTFAFQTLGTYAGMLLDPLHPAFRIGQLGEVDALTFALGVVAAAGLASALALCARRRWPAMPTAGLVLLGAGLAPVLHLLPTSIDVIAADRFLYVPVAGAALLGACAAARWRRAARPVALAIATLVLPAFAVSVAARNDVWSDRLALWDDTVAQASPLDPRPLQERAGVRAERGDLEGALADYEASFALRPERWVLERIGATLFALGRFEQALVPFARLVAADPERPQNHFHLALVHHRLAQHGAAAAALRRSLALAPDFTPAREMLAALSDS